MGNNTYRKSQSTRFYRNLTLGPWDVLCHRKGQEVRCCVIVGYGGNGHRSPMSRLTAERRTTHLYFVDDFYWGRPLLLRDFPDHATFRETGAKLACADKLGVFLCLTLCNKANFDPLQQVKYNSLEQM